MRLHKPFYHFGLPLMINYTDKRSHLHQLVDTEFYMIRSWHIVYWILKKSLRRMNHRILNLHLSNTLPIRCRVNKWVDVNDTQAMYLEHQYACRKSCIEHANWNNASFHFIRLRLITMLYVQYTYITIIKYVCWFP